MTDLKKCPFCGRKIGLTLYDVGYPIDDRIIKKQWSVFCDRSGGKAGCGAMCGYHETKEEAIEAWNRRATNG